MLSMHVVFSNFGLGSGNGLSPLAISTIIVLLVGGGAMGFWADGRWPAEAPTQEPEEALSSI